MTWFGSAIRQFLGVVWSWKWTYLVPIATLLLPATIYALRLPDTYDATAVIQISEKVTRSAGPMGSRDEASFNLINKTRDQVLAMRNVVALLPFFEPEGDPGNQALLRELSTLVEWNRLGDNAFSVRCTHTDGQVAAGAVNALCEKFLEGAKETPVAEAREHHNSAQRAVDTARREHEEALQALQDFYRTHANLGASDLDFKRLESELTAHRTRLAELRGHEATLQKRIKEIDDVIAKGPSGLEDTLKRHQSGLEKTLEDQLSNEQSELTSERAKYAAIRASKGKKHPKVIRALAAIDALERSIEVTRAAYDKERKAQDTLWRTQIRSERQVWFKQQSDRLAVLKRQLRVIAPEVAQIQESEEKIFATLREAPALQQQARPLISATEAANEVLKKALEAEASTLAALRFKENSAASIVTPYQLVEPAVAPAQPTGPSRLKYMIMAIAAGTMLGYGLMLLKRRFVGSNVVDAKDIAGLLPGALVIEVPRLEEGPIVPVASVAKDIVFGSWVAGCLGVAVLAIAAHKELLEAPAWLAKLLGKGL